MAKAAKTTPEQAAEILQKKAEEDHAKLQVDFAAFLEAHAAELVTQQLWVNGNPGPMQVMIRKRA